MRPFSFSALTALWQHTPSLSISQSSLRESSGRSCISFSQTKFLSTTRITWKKVCLPDCPCKGSGYNYYYPEIILQNKVPYINMKRTETHIVWYMQKETKKNPSVLWPNCRNDVYFLDVAGKKILTRLLAAIASTVSQNLLDFYRNIHSLKLNLKSELLHKCSI